MSTNWAGNVTYRARAVHRPRTLDELRRIVARAPSVRVLGGFRRRKLAFRPSSIINTSAMSYGSLSGPAVEAINRGVALCGGLQNTGEGGISDYHRHGGEIIWQIGTGYFGCRDEHGKFSLDRAIESIATAKVKAIELKLSQGAKPGLGGVLPAAKISPVSSCTWQRLIAP